MKPFLAAHWVCTIVTSLMHSPLLSAQECQLLENTPLVSGIYCPENIEAAFNSLPHLCRAMCLQTPNCAAYNYNTSDNTCTRLTAPCPQPQSDPVMKFGALIARKPQECCEWIPFIRGGPRVERMVAVDENPTRTVARTTSGGANYFGYYFEPNDACYIATSATNGERIDGHPCQLLRITEGCAVLWEPYTAGDRLPAKVVIGGNTADGDNVYVASMYNKCGYYPHGATHGSVPHGEGGVQTARNMKLLVLI